MVPDFKPHQIGRLDFRPRQLLTEALSLQSFSNRFANIERWLVPTCPSESGPKTDK